MSRIFLIILLLCLLPTILAQRSGGSSSSSSTTYHYYSSGSSSSGGGSCSTGCVVGLAVGGVIVVIISIVWCIWKNSNGMGGDGINNQQFLQTPAPTVMVSHGSKTVTPTASPIHPISGTWRGAYHGSSRRNGGSHIMSIELTFNGTRVEGYHGSDEVGNFTMEGDFRHDNHKIAMVKRYGYDRPVRYQGAFTSSTSMNGTWHTVNGDYGSWNLQCVTPNVMVAPAHQPVYQATVANHHVIEMNNAPSTTQAFGYSNSTAPPYSPSPRHAPRSVTPSPQYSPRHAPRSVTPSPRHAPRSITPTPDAVTTHLSAPQPVHVTPRLSATPSLTPTPTPNAVMLLNDEPEGMPPAYRPATPTSASIYTYIPTYGVPQQAS